MSIAARIADLDQRAATMRRFGYIASALVLQQRADYLRGYA